MKTDPNSPVHPPANINLSSDWHGLTKRELFAAMALQGMLSHGLTSDAADDNEQLALWAVDQADELIKALNEEAL